MYFQVIDGISTFVQKLSAQMLLIYTFLIQVLLVHTSLVPIKAFLEIVTAKKIVIFKEVLSNTKIFNFCFMNKIKDIYIDKVHKKNCLIIEVYNDNKNSMLI